jgi:signal transduction histidine kinase/FixJ family two-component response regulator
MASGPDDPSYAVVRRNPSTGPMSDAHVEARDEVAGRASFPPLRSDATDLFAGSGEMAALMRVVDWSQTPLGPVESWSPTLRAMVRLLLANRFPLLLWWGPEYASIYNDAYRPILGRKHPQSIGQPVREVWAEIWHILQPLIDTPFHGGPSTWMEDIALELNRHDFLEETHFTIAYSPVPDGTAPHGIGGVLATVHEITGQVVGERRTRTLSHLGARSTEAKTAADACATAADILSAHGEDVPFASLYLLTADGTRAELAGSAGVAIGDTIAPRVVELSGSQSEEVPAPLREAMIACIRSEAMQTIDDLAGKFAAIPPGPWSDPPRTAIVAAIPSNRAHQMAGVLVAGVSARLALDEQYRGFLELVTAQCATAIANARAYEEERRRAEALAEIDRLKTEFFTNVSHEFRTPLTLLLGPLEDVIGRETGLSSTVRDELVVAHRSAVRLLKLVNSLLDFSRIQAGRTEALFQPTDLSAYTAELVSTFRSATERAGLRLSVEAPPLAQPVWVDRGMWEKILLNLVSNAFKHTFEGEIQVRVTSDEHGAVAAISDTGIGIANDQLPHLFERFHRVPNARSRTHEGTGIGLALVQELVKIHGGAIDVESEPGVGTRFTVSLPFGNSHLPAERLGGGSERRSNALGPAAYVDEAVRWLPAAGEPTIESSPDASSQTARILVADDNADMRDYVTRLLRERGWAVDAVVNGRDALLAARTQMPDVVLTDIMMPELDGVQLLRALRDDPRTRSIPIILLSARAGEEARVEGMQAGADDYLVKPFVARELVARVETQVRRSREMAEERREMEVTERVLEATERERARFRELFTQAPAAIAVLRGPEHVYEIANNHYLRLIGHRDILGKRVRDARPELDGQGIYELLDGVFQTGTPFVGDQFRAMVDSDGDGTPEEHFYNFVYQPLREADGAVSGVFIHAIEVTQLVESRRAAESARTLADHANRAKSDFLAAMSHELRTPLNAIAGHTELLEMEILGTVNASQRNALERIRRSEQHLLSLITDVLNFAKLEAGRVEYDIQDVPLANAVEDVVSMIHPQLAAKNITLSVSVDTALVARADPEKVRQILLNLLSNAVKFTAAGGRVVIDTPSRAHDELPPGAVYLRVTDTGIGIPRDKQGVIFDAFVQVYRDLTRTTEGTGLGLTISRDLARKMGGDLRVRSVPGVGSSFTLSLPE